MLRPNSPAYGCIIKVIFALVVASSSGTAPAFAAESPWVSGHKTKARLVSGKASQEGERHLAFVEIVLEPGWKTYWRAPGDAGGLPPSFDWSKSTNLASADVMFPAPQRFIDKSGNTIGYHDGLILPVAIAPTNDGEPVALAVDLQYGICKDVCVPIDVSLSLTIAPDEADPLTPEAAQALDSVPRAQDKLRDGDPALIKAEADLGGAQPKISIAARFPQGVTGAEAFLEAPHGLFLPIPELVGRPSADGVLTFEAALGSDVDLSALKGKPVTVTLVGEAGSSFATFVAK